jgi:protein-S-isoprenylcysteine O-methyltransferase Ste14
MRMVLLGVLLSYGAARLLETFRKRDKLPGQVVASYTLCLLVVAHAAVFLVSLHDLRHPQEQLSATHLIGVLLVAVAAVGRYYAITTLGPYHSIQIEIRQNHPVISHGPYLFIRNPYYVSNAVEVVGFPLMVNSFIGASAAILLYWPCLYLRIVLEERALLEAIKEPFSDYMRRVPRLVPHAFGVGARI